jgi:biopolymer transport protein TolR
MAAPLAAGRGRRRNRSYRPLAEINVTPLVDVMLVLLIVFMIAAPLLTVGVPVDLPRADAPQINERAEPVVVTVDAKGQIYIQNTVAKPNELVPRLRAMRASNPELRIYVKGDQALQYGKIMEVMGLINAGGITKVALVANLPDQRR